MGSLGANHLKKVAQFWRHFSKNWPKNKPYAGPLIIPIKCFGIWMTLTNLTICKWPCFDNLNTSLIRYSDPHCAYQCWDEVFLSQELCLIAKESKQGVTILSQIESTARFKLWWSSETKIVLYLDHHLNNRHRLSDYFWPIEYQTSPVFRSPLNFDPYCIFKKWKQ